MSERMVRVEFPGIEGKPLVRASRLPALTARGWSEVRDDESPDPAAPDAAPQTPVAKSATAKKKPGKRAASTSEKE